MLSNRPPTAPSSQAPTPVSPVAAATASPRKPTRPRAKRAGQSPWESDAELVSEILAGSRAHFDLLYEAYFPRVYRFALKRLRDPAEAEDVTQEVFTTVFRSLHTYAGNSTLLVWIFGITRNKVHRRFRRARPHLEALEDEVQAVPAPDVPVDRIVEARRILAECERIVEEELTPLQRRIFHLKHLRRQSIRSIAHALGKSEDAVKANLYRMRRTLAQTAPGLEQLLSA